MKLTILQYCCTVAYRSAQNFEAIAQARVAPKVRRDQAARDSVEDPEVQRLRTAHDDDSLDHDGSFEDIEMTLAADHDVPVKPMDDLSQERWQAALSFSRQRMSKFVKDVARWGFHRETYGTNTSPKPLAEWQSDQRSHLQKERSGTQGLSALCSHSTSRGITTLNM